MTVPNNSCSFLMVHSYYPWKIVLLGIFDYNNVSFPSLQLSFQHFYFPTLGSIFKLCVTHSYLVFICRVYLRPWESAVLATQQGVPFMSFLTALGCLLLRSLRASEWIPILVDFLGPLSVASFIIYLGILEKLLALVWLKCTWLVSVRAVWLFH